MRALLIGLLVNCAGLLAQPGNSAVPLFFIENHGQVPGSVRFMVKGSGITAYFSPSEVLYRAGGKAARIEFPGASYSVPEGAGQLPGHANFLRGKPEEWVTDVSLFGGVVYRNLYPGIDLRYSAEGRNLKSQFEVSPGSDPSVVLMRYGDASGLSVSETGELLVPLNGQLLREAAPFVFQNAGGKRVPVEGRFVLAGAGTVRFVIGPYDHSLPLVVDPSLSYSTFLGGSSANAATAMAVDVNGDAYLTGFTSSYNFPAVNPEQSSNAGGNEVFVVKLNGVGNGLVYSTYIGGSGDDRGFGIAVDANGSAFVTGSTTSHNFPTRFPIQSAMLGGKNAFVLKLSPAGNYLTFSTYLGGSGSDAGNGIALDPSGNAYVVGDTTSVNFPATVLQRSNKGGQDAFVASIGSDGSHLLYSTYLGGSGVDHGAAIAVDSSGEAYVTGSTFSPDFPVASAFQKNNAGGQDAFVAKLAAGGSALTFSTYLGGSAGSVGSPEAGQGIALDASGNAYVAGVTGSANFPVLNAVQSSLDSGLDAFVSKLSPTGTLLYSTYLGGSGIDVGNAIAVSSSGNAYVVGYTASTDFPVQGAVQTANGGDYDAFVTELSPSGNSLLFSTYLGGSGSDTATAVAVDSAGSIYVAGWTLSNYFPLANPYQSVNTDNYAAFVSKIVFPNSVPAVVGVTPSSGSGSTQTFALQFSDVSGAGDISSVAVLFNTSASQAGACSVTYSVSQNALALLTDAGTAPGTTIAPGSGTQQNSQCILNGAGSSVTMAGVTLTVNLALTFQPAFSGAKTVYMQATNPIGSTGWLSKGAWTVLVGSVSAMSVTPSSGSGSSQAFAFQFSDTAGAADIASVSLLFNTSASTVSACSVTYVRAQNTLALLTDAGAAPGTTLTPGSGTQQNSQCTLSGAGSSVSASGNLLTVTVLLTFQTAFQGAKTVYMQATTPSGSTTWQSEGAWTVQFATASAVSVSPSSGSGSAQVFAFQFSDTAGATDLTSVSILFNSSASAVSACSVTYVRAQNTLALLTDAGAAPGATLTPGSGTQQNSQCVLNGSGSSAGVSGNVLTLTLSLTFQPAFQGGKTIYMQATNPSGTTAWQSEGTWTVQFVASTVSVSPASGSGSSQTFAFQFSDTGGATDLTSVSFLFNASASTVSACSVTYVRAQNTLALLTDAGAAPGTTLTPGSGSQQNSQCTLNGSGSSASASGNVLTLTVSLTFQSAFQGAKTVYMQAVNPSGSTGWQSEGAWTVQVATASPVSVSPSSGSGSAQVFAFQFSDTAGAADLTSVSILFNSSASTVSACSVTYVRAQNTLALLTDAGAAPGATLTPGSGTQQNSQCTLNGSGSSASNSGNVLTLTVSLTFQPAFQGGKTIYMQATNPSGTTAWQSEGTWTVQFVASAVSVSPASGSGSSQTFAFQFSDTGGATDLTSVSFLFNTSASTVSACSVTYVRAQNTLALLTDAGAAPGTTLTPGSGSQQNSQCTLNGSGSSASASGNVLTLTVSLTFQSAFQGAKTVYMQAVNPSGSTGWQSKGAWTVQFGTASVVSVNPSSGTGSAQTFAFQFSDTSGAADLASVSALFNTSASSVSACSVTYVRAQNTLALLTDAGAAPGTTLTPGSGTQQNSQCTLNGSGSSVSTSGNLLTLTLALTFQPAFQGAKTIYMQATNPSGTIAWQASGSWTVPSGSSGNPYAYSRSITISHAKVPNTDQTNFPVLISGVYSYLATTANGGQVQNANGYDIVFSSDAAAANLLSFEREKYVAATGEVDFWVRIPTLSHTADTTIYMSYGNGAVATDQAAPTQVWDGNYEGVWHFPNGTTLSGNDSTGNGFNLVSSGSTPATPGQIDGGASFNGSNQYLTNGALSIAPGSSITVSYWSFVATANLQGASAFTIGGADNPNRIQAHSPWTDKRLYWDYGSYASGGRISADYTSSLDKWSYVTLTYSAGSSLHAIYLNGVLITSSTSSNSPVNTETGIDIGRWAAVGYQKGNLDEFRVSNAARSADWIATEYNNQTPHPPFTRSE